METENQLQPHQQRVVDEKNELAEKVTKLGAFILDNPIFTTLEVSEQKDMHIQLFCMENYLNVLEKRINRF